MQSMNSATYSELFLQSFPPSDNVVYKPHKDRILQGYQQFKGWAQVFDLKDSVLICQVEGNELDMRLIHFTEQPLQDYLAMVEKGKSRIPSHNVKKVLMKTIEEYREEIKRLFNDFNSAKIIVDGQITPQIHFEEVHEQVAAFNSNFGYQSVVPMDENSLQYRITFVTTENQLYHVDFERFFLKNKDSIKVHHPRDLSALVTGTVKSVDKFKDLYDQTDIYIIGTGIDIIPQQPETAEDSVFLVREDRQFNLRSHQYLMSKPTANLLQQMTKSIKHKLSHLSTAKRATEEDQKFKNYNLGGQEGVIAVKSLSNNVFAAVYTSGYLRIWSIKNQRIMAEHYLLDKAADDDAVEPENTLRKQSQRISQCKITSFTAPVQFNHDQQCFSKSIKLALAYTTQKQLNLKVEWRLDQFELNFFRVEPNYDKQREDQIDLGIKPMVLEQGLSQIMDENIEISEIMFEQQKSDSTLALWMSTFDVKNKLSRLVNVYGTWDNIWDKALQTEYHELLDNIDLPQYLVETVGSPYQATVTDHLISRLTAKNRFTKAALKEQLGMYQENGITIREKIESLGPQVVLLKKLLKGAVTIENVNSTILGVSPQLKHFPFRLVVRPLGVSVLRENTQVSNLMTAINKVCVKVGRNQEDMTYDRMKFCLSADEPQTMLAQLIGGVKYLVLSNLTEVDKQIAENPEQINQILSDVLLTNKQSQSLHQTILTLVTNHRNEIDEQFNELIEGVLINLLQNNSQSAQALLYPDLMATQPIQFNPIFLKAIESGLSEEINNLYELLRDMAIFSLYLKEERPYVNLTNQEIGEESEKFDLLLSWIKQTLAIRNAFDYRIDFNELQDRVVSNKKKNLVFQLRDLANYDQFSECSILTYLLATNNKLYAPTQLPDPRFANDMYLSFEDLVTRLINNFTFQYATPSRAFNYVPQIVRRLASLDLWREILKYVKAADVQTVSFDFLKALAVAHINENPSEFLTHLNDCYSKFELIQDEMATDCSPLLINQKKADDVMSMIRRYSKDSRVELTLVLLHELRPLDEHYSIYVLKTALSSIPYLVDNAASDYLYEQLFSVSKVSTSLEYMYQACTSINDGGLRQQLLGTFFERLTCDNSQYILSTTAFFEQEDIQMVFTYFTDKCTRTLDNNSGQKYSLQWKKDLENLCKILHLVAQLYQRHQEVLRFLWHMKTNIFQLTKKEQDAIGEPKIENVQRLIELEIFILELVYVNTLKLQDHIFVTEPVDKRIPNNKKRSLEAMSNQSEEQIVLNYQDQAIAAKGFDILSEEQYESKFIHGSLKVITLEEIRKAMLFAQARLLALDYRPTSADPLTIVKILAETRQFDMAIELALAYKKGVTYAIAANIQDLYVNKQLVRIEDYGEGDSYRWNQEQILKFVEVPGTAPNLQNQEKNRDRYIQQVMDKYLDRLDAQEVVELARDLVALDLPIPVKLEKALVEKKRVYLVVAYYFSKQAFNFESAFQIIWKNLPQSVENLASANLNLLAQFLQVIEEAERINEDNIEKLSRQLARMKVQVNADNIGERRFLHPRQSVDEQQQQDRFNADLNEFYQDMGIQGGAIERIRRLEEQAEGLEVTYEMRDLELQIQESTRLVTMLKQGGPQIRRCLVNYLNSQ